MWAAFAAAGGPLIGGSDVPAVRGGVAAVFPTAASIAAAAVVVITAAGKWTFVADNMADHRPEA